MATYVCSRCGGTDDTGWTYYWVRKDMDLPVLCATCDPTQRCHWHNEAERARQQALTENATLPVTRQALWA